MSDFWCLSDRPLDEIFALFQSAFPSDEFEQDAENVWAWIEGKTRDKKLGFNISRRHHMDENLPVEPVAFRLTKYSSDINTQEIGSLLARALSTKVYLGEIKYLSGDEFSFKEVECFAP